MEREKDKKKDFFKSQTYLMANPSFVYQNLLKLFLLADKPKTNKQETTKTNQHQI